MKRINIILLSVLTVFFMTVIISCDSRERLYIYNWTSYTPDSVIEKFEKEFNVRVIYDEFTTNEEMFAKLHATRGGRGGYDVVFPSKDIVPAMINEGMLARIDHSKIENLRNIDPQVISLMDYDPNMQYSVPYFYGAAGIAVNTARVPNFERSWSIFARQDLRNRMTMLDDMRETMGAALLFLGHSANTINPAHIREAEALLNNVWKPNLVRFDSETFGMGYANGDFWVVHGFPENIYEEIIDEPQKLREMAFFFPIEGSPSYIDNMVILSNARNTELAHKFINFIHRPDIYAEFVDAFGLPATVNIPARALKTGHSFYSAEDLLNTELVHDVGEHRALYDSTWDNSIRVGK